jgi:hypothetical protein
VSTDVKPLVEIPIKHLALDSWTEHFCSDVTSQQNASRSQWILLTLFNPIFLPPTYSPALIYFGRERGWCITCNYPTVLKEKT